MITASPAVLIVPLTYDLYLARVGNTATAIMRAPGGERPRRDWRTILNYNLDQRPHGTLGMYDLRA